MGKVAALLIVFAGAPASAATFEAGACPDKPEPIPALRAAAKPLNHGTLVIVPGVGHFVVPKSDCARRVMASFLADPAAPDTGCVAALKPPPFTIAPR